ncbi:MAG: hypothetical protein ACYCZN_14995 [Candidatus Dormibacteria bacterium]
MEENVVRLSLALPLDSDGFLRRECPTCEREFKWLPTPEGQTAYSVPDGGYFCPYCGLQAPNNAWFTSEQIALAHGTVVSEVLSPELVKFRDSVNRIGRGSQGLVRMQAQYREPDKPEPLTEVDDMSRVEFECHPDEPLKVLEDWPGPVRCLVCGATAP